MGRARVLAGGLGALTTLVVALPLTQLFEEATWYAPAALGVLVVAVSGMVLRALTASTGLIVLGQFLAGWLYLLLTQLESTTSFGILPSGQTLPLLIDHVRDAQETITKYAAPAPTTAGITVVLIVIVIVIGLAVDMSSATAASPVIAGLPLLSLFLVSAANSGGSLPWGWFLTGASLWLVMVIHQSDVDLREWTTSIPLMGHDDGQRIAERSHRWQAVRLGAVGLATAMLVATLVPHLPTRYVLDGLGRGSGGPDDGIRLSTELDLKRSLESPSREPVLRYTTDDPTPEPLRVAVVEDFNDGFGRMRSQALEPQEGFTPPDPMAGVSPDITRDRRTLVVDDNGVAAPQLALPTFVDGVETGGIPWALGPDGTARVQRTPGTYSATFTELSPQAEDFTRGDPAGSGDPEVEREEYLLLDPGSAERIQQLSDRLAPADADDLRTAQAIQEYLRASPFTYDLDLPQPEDAPNDPVLSFLETKVGYCQQFAATMTLLARAQGIPARVVVGFLPGELVDGKQRVIRASDAHAWPELHLEGVGWVRFEPTPGARAADVPGYSIDTGDGREGADTETATSASTSTTRSEAVPRDDVVEEPVTTMTEGLRRWLWWLLGAFAGLAALAIMPVTAVLTRRRDRARATDDAARVEVAWRDLVGRLEDLGVDPPTGATPRQTGQWLGHRLPLAPETQGRLDHVVATLEQARYAAPGQPLPEISAETAAVVADVRSSRRPTARAHALLWPRTGVTAWRSLLR